MSQTEVAVKCGQNSERCETFLNVFSETNDVIMFETFQNMTLKTCLRLFKNMTLLETRQPIFSTRQAYFRLDLES